MHPGLVDAHVHASFQLLRGIHADEADEDTIFGDVYAPFLNAVSDEDEHVAVLLACLEMVRNGTTCFLEAGTVLEPAAAAEAAQRVGVRAVLGDPFIWDRPADLAQGRDAPRRARRGHVAASVERAPKDIDEALARLGRELRRNADPDALVRGHVCLNGLGTATEALIVEAKRRADAAGVVMSMHHAYSAADTRVDHDRFGPHPLVHLMQAGALGGNVTLAHANHLSDREADAIVSSGTSLVWAPTASMLWGHGGSLHSRHARLWRRGANVALGSDSANWSNDLDVFRQADVAILTTRDIKADRASLGALDAMRMATRGGARAAGLEAHIGSIEVGKRADLVIHAHDRPELFPRTDTVRNVVHAARSKSVRTVIIDGRVILRDGDFVAVDERAVLAAADGLARSLLRRLQLA